MLIKSMLKTKFSSKIFCLQISGQVPKRFVGVSVIWVLSSTISVWIFLGICNTAGRVLFGVVVAYVPKVSSLMLHNVCMLLASLSVLLIPLCTTYSAMVVAIAVYGLTICK